MVTEHVAFNYLSKRTESKPTKDVMMLNFNNFACQIHNIFKTIYLNLQIFNTTYLESVYDSLSLYKNLQRFGISPSFNVQVETI